MELTPTERETEILKILWGLGEASVRDVHARLEPETGLHFNTVQTLLRIMDDKGLVKHRRDGRSFIYSPVCSRAQIASQFLHKVFDGALADLVLSMLSTEKLGSKKLRELEDLIAASREKKTAGRKKGE